MVGAVGSGGPEQLCGEGLAGSGLPPSLGRIPLQRPPPQVLSTRVYRGRPPASAAAAQAAAAAVEGPAAAAEPAASAAAAASGCGIAVVALGGTALLESAAAWEMGSCWEGEER